MSFLALAISVCTPLYCSTYNIDTFDNDAVGRSDCKVQMHAEMNTFIKAWNDTSSVAPLREWLMNHEIFEEPAEVQSYNFDCLKFEDAQPNDYDSQKFYAGIEK